MWLGGIGLLLLVLWDYEILIFGYVFNCFLFVLNGCEIDFEMVWNGILWNGIVVVSLFYWKDFGYYVGIFDD